MTRPQSVARRRIRTRSRGCWMRLRRCWSLTAAIPSRCARIRTRRGLSARWKVISRRWRRSGQLANTPGLGKTILARVNEALTTGHIRFHDELAEKIPVGLRQMTRIPGLGAKRVRQLNSELGISTLQELQQAAQEGKIASVSGFGAKSQENILKGIEFLQQHQDRFRIDIAEAQAEAVAAELRALPQVVRLAVAGSIRRRRETVHDIDIVGSVAQESDREPIMKHLLGLPSLHR